MGIVFDAMLKKRTAAAVSILAAAGIIAGCTAKSEGATKPLDPHKETLVMKSFDDGTRCVIWAPSDGGETRMSCSFAKR